MSTLAMDADAYNRLQVPRAEAGRLVDEWIEACAGSRDEFESKALLVAVNKIRGYLDLADKDIRCNGARSERRPGDHQPTTDRDYRDFLMMAIAALDAVEDISHWRYRGDYSKSGATAPRFTQEVREALLGIVDAVDGFKGLTLTREERGWLNEYARQLRERFPRQIEDIFVYTLGEYEPDPEFRTLILIRNGERATEREISKLGHMIDMSGFFVAPLIKVCAMTEWAYRKRIGDPTYRLVERKGVSVV